MSTFSTARWVRSVEKELSQAMDRFPPMQSPHEGWAILKEEVDEMWDEIKANDFAAAHEEAVQVAAMAIRYLYDMQDFVPPAAQTNRKVYPAL